MEQIFGNSVSHNNQIALQNYFAYSAGQKVVYYSIENNEQQNFLIGQAQVNSVLISRDGNLIYTGEQSFKSPAINIYKITTDKIIYPTYRLIGHKFGIKQLLESPIQPYLFSLGTEQDKTLFLWDLQTNKSLAINKLQNKVNSIRFSKTGTILISTGQSHLQYWQFRQDGTPIFEGLTLQCKSFQLFEQFIQKNYIDCFIDDKVYAFTQDGLLCIFSLVTKQLLSFMQLDIQQLLSYTFNGIYFFFGSTNSKIQICDSELQHIQFLTQSNNQITSEYDCIGIEANDTYLISVYRNKNIAIWNINSINKIEQIRILYSHNNFINDLIILKPQSIQDVSFFASISEQYLTIWHTNSNINKIKKFNMYNNITYSEQFKSDFQYNELKCLCQSSDGQYLAIGDTYGLLKIFSFVNFKQLASVQAHTLKITVIQYWNFNNSFMTGSEDKTIAIYEKSNYKNYKLLSHHTDSILNIFTYQNKIITYSKDKYLTFLEYSQQNFNVYHKSQLIRINSIDQDQNLLFILQDGIISVIDILQNYQKLILNIQDCLKLRVSHQDNYTLLVTASYNKVTIYKYMNQNDYKQLEELDIDNIVMIEFVNNNTYLIFMTREINTIILWKLNSIKSIQQKPMLQQDNWVINTNFWENNIQKQEQQNEEVDIIKFDSESDESLNEKNKIISETPRLDLLALTLGVQHAGEIKKQLNQVTQSIKQQIKIIDSKQEEQDLLHNPFYEEQKSMQEFHKKQNSKIMKRQLMNKKIPNVEFKQDYIDDKLKIEQDYIITNSIVVPNQSYLGYKNQNYQIIQYDKMPILEMDIKRFESSQVMKNIQQSIRNQSKFQNSFQPENSIMLNCSYNFTERKQDNQNYDDENLLYVFDIKDKIQNQQINIAKCHLRLMMISLTELIEGLNQIQQPIRDKVLVEVDKDLLSICQDVQDIRQVDSESIEENQEDQQEYIQKVVSQCSEELFENYVKNLLGQMFNQQ